MNKIKFCILLSFVFCKLCIHYQQFNSTMANMTDRICLTAVVTAL